jgi:hypothetical protein
MAYCEQKGFSIEILWSLDSLCINFMMCKFIWIDLFPSFSLSRWIQVTHVCVMCINISIKCFLWQQGLMVNSGLVLKIQGTLCNLWSLTFMFIVLILWFLLNIGDFIAQRAATNASLFLNHDSLITCSLLSFSLQWDYWLHIDLTIRSVKLFKKQMVI